MSPLSIVIVEDDAAIAALEKQLLERRGHKVHTCLDALNSVKAVRDIRPDILILDIMMPGMDGLEVCRLIRQDPAFSALKIIVVSSKIYQADRDRAMTMGANGMLQKPISAATFVDDVVALASDSIEITYWGVRGTMPVPGAGSLRYGGNTNCVTLEMPRDQYFVLDAGSGIRELSKHILATRGGKLAAKILISHPHWDHINALPFFAPLYIPGNEFQILGPSQGKLTIRDMIAAQMDGTYFPVTLRELGAHVIFRDLAEEEITFGGGVSVRTLLLTHPGNCLGYRISLGGRSFCYITDNEMHLPGAPGYDRAYVDKLVRFVSGCDVLFTDTTYTDGQYKSHVNWGHSCVSQVVNFAHAAGVKELQIMHHDPDQTDDDIDRKLEDACAQLLKLRSSVRCTAPSEGLRLRLSSTGELTTLKG